MCASPNFVTRFRQIHAPQISYTVRHVPAPHLCAISFIGIVNHSCAALTLWLLCAPSYCYVYYAQYSSVTWNFSQISSSRTSFCEPSPKSEEVSSPHMNKVFWSVATDKLGGSHVRHQLYLFNKTALQSSRMSKDPAKGVAPFASESQNDKLPINLTASKKPEEETWSEGYFKIRWRFSRKRGRLVNCSRTVRCILSESMTTKKIFNITLSQNPLQWQVSYPVFALWKDLKEKSLNIFDKNWIDFHLEGVGGKTAPWENPVKYVTNIKRYVRKVSPRAVAAQIVVQLFDGLPAHSRAYIVQKLDHTDTTHEFFKCLKNVAKAYGYKQ